MNENCSQMVVDAAKHSLQHMEEKHIGWEKAFFRFHMIKGSNWGITGSYVKDSNVQLFDPFGAEEEIYGLLIEKFREIWQLLENEDKGFLICLLVLEKDFNYKILFEHEDPNIWSISKMDGETGIPVGYESRENV